MNKQDMVNELAKIADEHSLKKEAIIKLLDDLDADKSFSDKHINGIAAVNTMMKELEELEKKHDELVKKIKE